MNSDRVILAAQAASSTFTSNSSDTAKPMWFV